MSGFEWDTPLTGDRSVLTPTTPILLSDKDYLLIAGCASVYGSISWFQWEERWGPAPKTCEEGACPGLVLRWTVYSGETTR